MVFGYNILELASLSSNPGGGGVRGKEEGVLEEGGETDARVLLRLLLLVLLLRRLTRSILIKSRQV